MVGVLRRMGEYRQSDDGMSSLTRYRRLVVRFAHLQAVCCLTSITCLATSTTGAVQM